MTRDPENPVIVPAAEDLIPVADQLCALARRIGYHDAGNNEVLRTDLTKLSNEADTFREELPGWFTDRAAGEGREAFTHRLRAARHDARNRLNHLFGIIQLIRIGNPPPAVIDASGPVIQSLEECLLLLDRIVEAEPTGAPTATPSSVSDIVPGSAGYLLIADDDGENRDILERLLTPHGFRLAFAVNGLEVISRIASDDFDAVLLDIQMPEMDGFSVLSHLRETGVLRNTPVIVITGLQGEQDAVRCIENGAEDFLSRPIRPALLMARLSASLEKKRLREKVFEQHFTPELARELARNPDPMKMQARHADVTVLFCDIRGFSSVSERLGPSQTIAWLSGVMGEFSSVVIDHGGVLVDYTGDELLAMWGAPNEQPNHAELACQAALGILDSLPALNAIWHPIVDAETAVGIGINSGDALVGNVGTHRKFKYGPLGTTVNLASRVQGATKFLKTSLLITGDTADRVKDTFPSRRLCQVRVQNIKTPVHLHELHRPELHSDWYHLATQYESALDAFERGDLKNADLLLGEFLLALPDDGPAAQLLRRIREAIEAGFEAAHSIWTLPGK
ncbi:MAG: response regulator [Verrucomicrobiales bacterium]|nr:response regulator [Verrucomicrobiales bacterium]MBP9224507.1 response regulator [Verrucomicrobiales bacterium]